MEERAEWSLRRDRRCRRLDDGRFQPGSRGCWRSPGGDPSGCSHHQALVAVRRDLHDQVGSTLAGIAMRLELAWRLVSLDAGTAYTVLSELRSEITELIANVRRIGGGWDTAHRVGNVEAALRAMIRRANRAVAPRLELSLDFDPRVGAVPDRLRSAAFWIVCEAVVNVLKHSTAQRCTVALSVRGAELHVRVEDDGPVAKEPPSRGCGLANMSARAAAQGGWCSAGPLEPVGFAVTACLPLPGTRD